jgi:RNA polymerase sigma-70 factor (ECF subfamily)
MDTHRFEHDAVFATRLAEQSGYLLRFARSRLRDEHLAEEAVQDTLVAALQGGHSFAGRAKLRTWLTGILLHKIHDGFRRDARDARLRCEAPQERRDEAGGFDEDLEPMAGSSSAPVSPERALHCRQLGAAMDRAIKALPPRQAEVFLLREVSGLDTAEVCRTLGLSTSNAWVLFHRARAALRKALEVEGFSPA